MPSVLEVEPPSVAEPCHMLVFREERDRISGERLLSELRQLLVSGACSVDKNPPAIFKDILTDLLLRAGELESALFDSGHIQSRAVAELTDAFAAALLRPETAQFRLREAEQILAKIRISDTLALSRPEGFCYYGLHPLDYGELANKMDIRGPSAVIGIRSIGTTLSAVVAAALRIRDREPIERITVRPTGHPYNRVTRFSDNEAGWVRENNLKRACFFVVDEGPGLSGSSFLSVGEALTQIGVATESIVFLGSANVNPEALVADGAAERWRRFRFQAADRGQKPHRDCVELHGGEWRKLFLSGQQHYAEDYTPGVWTNMASPAFLSRERSKIYKFEGTGRYGAAVRERAALVGAAGFGPHALNTGSGFTEYPILKGRVLTRRDKCPALLDRIAEYLAFRAEHFKTDFADSAKLEEMARFNHRQLTGKEIDVSFSLHVESPVIADARMMPYEWIHSDASYFKLDSASHGDNHFFPGPTDICWDLAGVITEWELSHDEMDFLLSRYVALSGKQVNPAMLNSYLIAYSCFQAGYYSIAASAMQGCGEEKLLSREVARYLGHLTSSVPGEFVNSCLE